MFFAWIVKGSNWDNFRFILLVCFFHDDCYIYVTVLFFYLFFFCCCCLILLAKISARFWHTVSSRLGDAFVKFFCSFSSIECVLHLFSNVSPLKFQFHVKFTFLYWFSLQVNKFCLVQQIKQQIFIWFSLTLFIKYVCVFFYATTPVALEMKYT